MDFFDRRRPRKPEPATPASTSAQAAGSETDEVKSPATPAPATAIIRTCFIREHSIQCDGVPKPLGRLLDTTDLTIAKVVRRSLIMVI